MHLRYCWTSKSISPSLSGFPVTSSSSNTFCSQFSKPSHAKKKKKKLVIRKKGSNP